MIEFKNDIYFYFFIFLCLVTSLKCIWVMVIKKNDVSTYRFILLICSYCVLTIANVPNIYILQFQLFIQITYALVCTLTLRYTEEYNRFKDFIMTAVTFIITITNTFGKYYFSNGEISYDYFDLPNLIEGDFIISNIYNYFSYIIYYHMGLFKYSIQYYFNFHDGNVYMIQFFCGILLSVLFLGTLATKIENFLNIK